MLTTDITEKIDGLWKNGRDSIAHALEHFRERTEDADRGHDDKWIVISVEHAAECLCNRLLLQIAPTSKAFEPPKRAKVEFWFPSLADTLKEFKQSDHPERLSAAEHKLLVLLDPLPDLRHQFMHRIALDAVDLSMTAMCMIGLLKHIELRMGTAASDTVWRDPLVKKHVVDAIRYTQLEAYNQFIELFLREQYPNHFLPECPMCGVAAIIGSHCEACFEEFDSVLCPECGEEVCFIADKAPEVPVECPYCAGSY